MLSYEVPTEYLSPLAWVPLGTSRPGFDQSRPAVVASGTLNGGGGGLVVFVCLTVWLLLLI